MQLMWVNIQILFLLVLLLHPKREKNVCITFLQNVASVTVFNHCLNFNTLNYSLYLSRLFWDTHYTLIGLCFPQQTITASQVEKKQVFQVFDHSPRLLSLLEFLRHLEVPVIKMHDIFLALDLLQLTLWSTHCIRSNVLILLADFMLYIMKHTWPPLGPLRPTAPWEKRAL